MTIYQRKRSFREIGENMICYECEEKASVSIAIHLFKGNKDGYKYYCKHCYIALYAPYEKV